MSRSRSALGFIETVGLAAAIEAGDTACKTADVRLVGRENSRGNGMITIKIEGDVSAVKSALLAAHATASKVNKVVSVSIIPRPGEALEPVMVYNKQTLLVDSPKTDLASTADDSKEKPEVQVKEEETKAVSKADVDKKEEEKPLTPDLDKKEAKAEKPQKAKKTAKSTKRSSTKKGKKKSDN